MRNIRRLAIAISGLVLFAFILGLGTDSAEAMVSDILSQQAKLTGSGTWTGSNYGKAVAISGDFIIVGAPNEHVEGALNAGAAYISIRDQNGNWSQEVRLTGPDLDHSIHFGISVAIEGDTAVIGASGANAPVAGSFIRRSGEVYIYKRIGSSWILEDRLVASDAAKNDVFGASVGISADTIFVSATGQDVITDGVLTGTGSVYIFDRDENSDWIETFQLTANDGGVGEFYGSAAAISQNTIVVGAYSDNPDLGTGEIYRGGSAYLYTRDINGIWTQQAKLNASDAEPEDWFGYSVALHGDIVVVGAYLEDAIFGGTPVFNAGSAYVFAKDGNGNWVQQTKITDSNPGEWESFGYSVAVEGNIILVGARSDTLVAAVCQVDSTGTASLFKRNGATWDPQLKLVANDGEAWDLFGSSAAISGSTVVVGAVAADKTPGPTNNDNSGAVYVFSPDTLTPTVNFISAGSVLNENDITREDVTQITISFSEDLANPAGNNEQLDVTNPDNYSLIRNGNTAISIDSITYSSNCGAGPYIATAALNNNDPLTGGGYAFSISGSNVVDQAGNPLAGDGTNAGTDFIRNFIVTPIIVDDLDAEFTLAGTWTTNTSSNVDSYGGSSRITHPGSGDAIATFTPDLPSRGTYRLSIWLDQVTNGAKNMPVIINYEGGSATVFVSINNAPTEGGWVDLGTFLFDAGSSGSVIITNRADGFVFADAIKWDQQSIIASVENISDESDLSLTQVGSNVMFFAIQMVFFFKYRGWSNLRR